MCADVIKLSPINKSSVTGTNTLSQQFWLFRYFCCFQIQLKARNNNSASLRILEIEQLSLLEPSLKIFAGTNNQDWSCNVSVKKFQLRHYLLVRELQLARFTMQNYRAPDSDPPTKHRLERTNHDILVGTPVQHYPLYSSFFVPS